MFRYLVLALAFLPFAASSTISAESEVTGNWGKRWCASSTDDNEIIIQTDSVLGYDTFMLMTGAGAADVFVALEAENADSAVYSTSALSLSDLGAADLNPVLVTAALRMYGFRGKYSFIRILQNGTTDATGVCLLAGNL